MRIAASESIRVERPELLTIPSEPGFVDLTIVLSKDWKPEYEYRKRQLRYIVVEDVDSAKQLLREIGYG